MKKIAILVAICILTSNSITVFSQTGTTRLRIGTFDSRCVAFAFGRSVEFNNLRDSIEISCSQAKADSDKEKMDEIEQYKPTMQVLLHQQVFSNSSIINIVEKIKEKFPALVEENNLKLIISKWEVMFVDESIELIDITDQLVEFFNPDEATRKIIGEIKAMEPVPMEKISINPMD